MIASELYWLGGALPGRIAVMARPRGGEWLEDEVVAWRQAKINVVVSLLTSGEVEEFELENEEELCRREGMDFISFPIVDREVPASRSAARDLIADLGKMIAEGNNVAIHCRQGIGRAGLIAASLLAMQGGGAEGAFRQLSTVRKRPVPETPEQQRWVEDFVRSLPMQRSQV